MNSWCYLMCDLEKVLSRVHKIYKGYIIYPYRYISFIYIMNSWFYVIG